MPAKYIGKDIGTKMILLAIEDITERKGLESLLEESEERYRRLFETASDGIVLLEKREGKITHANPATRRCWGMPKRNASGINFRTSVFRSIWVISKRQCKL